MKTITLFILSLFIATQSYALSNSQRNLLFGLGAGVIFASALNAKTVHVTKVYQQEPVYVDPYYENMIHEEELAQENHRHERELRRENRRFERNYNRHERARNKHYRKHQKNYNRECTSQYYSYRY